jgi:poly(A) polymerase
LSDTAQPRPEPRVLARAEHPISRSSISENALKVLYRLHRSGFQAYLVGGAVRDLLLGRQPKDFDIGTNARPQQVRQLFRNARLIGRRFRLARVAFAGEIVEVATFRRSPEPPEMEEGETTDVLAPIAEADEYGTPEEDAWRRDFTVNGLFYDIADFRIIDHVGGLADLHAGVIRSIGPARIRFTEDPVRMMRAVEYAARLGFRLDDEAAEAIRSQKGDLHRAAPARISYELSESLRGGHAQGIFRGLEQAGLLRAIMPESALPPAGEALLWGLLGEADRAATTGKPLGEDTLLAMLLTPGFIAAARPGTPAALVPPELDSAVGDYVGGATLRLALSNHRSHVLRSAFFCLSRLFAPPRTRLVARTLRQEGFPVALDIARMLTGLTGRHAEALASWQRAVERLEAGLAPVDEKLPSTGSGRRRRRRGGGHRRRPAASAGTAGSPA